PNDVKAILSIIFLIVAAVLAYWRGSPIRPDFSTYIMVTAVFMVVAMWIFSEAGGKKGDVKKGTAPGQNKTSTLRNFRRISAPSSQGRGDGHPAFSKVFGLSVTFLTEYPSRPHYSQPDFHRVRMGDDHEQDDKSDS